MKDNTMAKRKSTKSQTMISQKTKDRATRTSLRTGVKLILYGLVSNSCPTCNTHRVTLVRNPVIIHERIKDRVVNTTNGIYPSCVTVMVRQVKAMTST